MPNKKTKIRGRNILFGSLVLLGLSFGPAAFDIGLQRFYPGVASRTCPSTAASMITNGHLSTMVGGNNNNSNHKNHRRTKIPVCSRHQNHNWEQESSNSNSSVVAQRIPMTRNAVSWSTVVLILVVAKLLSLPPTNPSSLGVGTTMAALALTGSASVPHNHRPQFRQAAILGGTLFAVVRFVGLYASSISSWYMGLLARSPLVTKALTTATIGVLGDTTAQYLETRVGQTSSTTRVDETDAENSKGAKAPRRCGWLPNYDRRRGLSVFGENILVSGPLLHFAYNAMEDLLPTTYGGRSAMLAALGHALLDNFVLDTVFLAIMFVTTGIAEGYVREILPQFRKDFVPTLKTGWLAGLCLLPVQFLLFRFFPLPLRVLGVNLIDIFWEAYISYMVHRRRRRTTTTGKELPST